MKPTANAFLDTRRKLKNDKYPVKITVYHNHKKKRYNLDIELTEADYLKIMHSQRLRDLDLVEIRDRINASIGANFEESLKKIGDNFSFEKFETVYFKRSRIINIKDVYSLFTYYISNQKEDGKIGNATYYNCALNSFRNYNPNDLKFEDINPIWLKKYEEYMQGIGRSSAYISMNIRALRAIYNQAIALHIITDDNYPFSTNRNDLKYKIRKGANTKKALTTEQLSVLLNHKYSTPAQQKHLDLWKFSFYANGLNFKDLCLLKYNDIQGDYITFKRAKTEHSTTSSQPIKFKLSESLKKIIDDYGCEDESLYIFPYYYEGISPQRQRDIVQSLTRNTNKHLKRICKDLGFEIKITTNYARHSFATFLKQKGIGIEVISEALGHTTTSTTMNYLDSFADETYNSISDILENF